MKWLKHITLLGFGVLILLVLASNTLAQGNSPNPTQQHQTIEAIVEAYFQQTATIEAIIADGNAEWLTATAEFDQAVEAYFQSALTATAHASMGDTPFIEAGLSTNQSANVRGCPSTECEVLGVISPTESFRILVEANDWFMIQFGEGNELGYLYAPLVSLPDGAAIDMLPTLTPSPSPLPSPTSTNTPLPPTATPNIAMTATFEAWGVLVEPKQSGIYQVGINIAPGTWESTGEGGGCYWERLDQYGDINDNHFGVAGGSVTILETDYEVMLDDCGIWEYVELRERILQDDAYEPKRDGFYTVGVEIAPGRWLSSGVGDSCYWARLTKYQDINDNHFGRAGGSVYINPADFEVNFEDCGIWEYVGP